jgi:hypothetical protein
MPQCIFPGCQNQAENKFGVRLRYPPQWAAFWAPDTNVFVCDQHATSGMRATVTLEANHTHEVETIVSAPGAHSIRRVTPIK